VQSPYNPLIEDYTEIFCMIDEGDIPSIQCTTSLRGPKSRRKVDGLSPIIIDFCIPVFTLSLNSIMTVLQFPENITLLAVFHIYTNVTSEET
jgi:hypothetical protein